MQGAAEQDLGHWTERECHSSMALMQATATPYPARLDIDYPEELNRLTTAFRFILIIPIAIVIGVLTAGATSTSINDAGQEVTTTSGGIVAGLFFATLMMILFRQRYPRWWFDFALELSRFATRVGDTPVCSPTGTRRPRTSRACTSSSTIPT